MPAEVQHKDVSVPLNSGRSSDMNWSRSDCVRCLTSLGLADTPKSSCLGCLRWNRMDPGAVDYVGGLSGVSARAGHVGTPGWGTRGETGWMRPGWHFFAQWPPRQLARLGLADTAACQIPPQVGRHLTAEVLACAWI
jgi:hypothetical protein